MSSVDRIRKMTIDTIVDDDTIYNAEEEAKSNNNAQTKDQKPVEPSSCYKSIHELARGSMSVVYQGIVNKKDKGKLETGTKVTMKQIRITNETDEKKLLSELRLLSMLRDSDHIIKLYDIIPPNDPKGFNALTLVFEFMDTDLGKTFKTKQFLTKLHVQWILYQILSGIKYIHSKNIAHCNLKPSKILINQNCIIKIRGFGSAQKIVNNDGERATENDGDTVVNCYRSPEMLLSISKSNTLAASDIWSVGCIFAELLQMQRKIVSKPRDRNPIFSTHSFQSGDINWPAPFPFVENQEQNVSRVDQIGSIFDVIGSPNESDIATIRDETAKKYLRTLAPRQSKNFEEIFPGADQHALDLLKKLLKFDVSRRMNIYQASKHPYLKDIRDDVAEDDGRECVIIAKARKNSLKFGDNLDWTKQQWRLLILKEILKYNKEDRGRFVVSGAMGKNALSIVFCGYIRKGVELIGSIPSKVVHIGCMCLL